MSNSMELRDLGAGEGLSRRMRKRTYDGVKALIDAHYARFPPNRYESEVYLPEDVLVHMDILDQAEKSNNLVHKITVDKQIPNCHKVAFASSYELNRHSKLSSMFSVNNLKIHHADTFPTSDQHYSLDLFVVEGFYGMHIDDISRMLDGACTTQPTTKRLKIALQISKGIEYLHGQLIIHKDINPSNILMDIDNVLKVDLPTSLYMTWAGKSIIPKLEALFHAFQLAEMNTPKIRRWTKFTGPEAMNTREFGDRSDVYSFGIVLCVILTAKLPYETLDKRTTIHTALRVLGGARPELPGETNPRLKNLIDKCLDGDSMYRPHISDVRRVLESLISELNTPTLTPIASASPSTSNSTSTLVLRNRFGVLADNPDS